MLYCAQGIPWGFVTVTLLAYVAEQGVGMEQGARITALATLPWSFKMIWGVVIDRFGFRAMGRRRPWVLLAQLCIGATAFSMILIDDLAADVELLAWMVFVHNCFVSLQDVATDALAVEVLAEEERGRVNGMMWASNFLGSAIGGVGMGTVLARFGVQAAFVLEVFVLLAIALFPLLIREKEGERLLPWTEGEAAPSDLPPESPSFRRLLTSLFRAVWARAQGVGVLFAATSSFMIGMMVTINPFFFTTDLGWSQESYSQFAGTVDAVAGVLGALVGGYFVDRFGVRLIYTLAGLIVTSLCFGMAASPGLLASGAFCKFYLFAAIFLTSAQTVAGFSLFMRLCTTAIAGTQFTLYMAITNLGRVRAAGLVGELEAHGTATIFGAMGVSMLVAIAVLYLVPAAYSRASKAVVRD